MSDNKNESPESAPPSRVTGGVGWLIIISLVAIVTVTVYFQPQIDGLLGNSSPIDAKSLTTSAAQPAESSPPSASKKDAAVVSAPEPAPVKPSAPAIDALVIDALSKQVEQLSQEMSTLKDEKATLEQTLMQTQKTVSEMESRLTLAEANAKQPVVPSVASVTPEAAPATIEAPPAAASPEQQKQAEELKKQIDDLQAKLTEQTKLVTEVQALKTQLDSRIVDIEKIAEQYSSEKQLSSFEQQEAWKQVSMLIHFDRLKTSILAGKSFMAEYDELYDAAHDNSAAIQQLTRFKAHQQAGIKTMEDLKTSFPDAVTNALFKNKPKRDTLWGSVRHNLSGLVKVRKTGGRPGADAESIIARAEDALLQDKLDVAMKELSLLEGEPAEAFASWLEGAKLRADATTMLDELKTALVKPSEQTMIYER